MGFEGILGIIISVVVVIGLIALIISSIVRGVNEAADDVERESPGENLRDE